MSENDPGPPWPTPSRATVDELAVRPWPTVAHPGTYVPGGRATVDAAIQVGPCPECEQPQACLPGCDLAYLNPHGEQPEPGTESDAE